MLRKNGVFKVPDGEILLVKNQNCFVYPPQHVLNSVMAMQSPLNVSDLEIECNQSSPPSSASVTQQHSLFYTKSEKVKDTLNTADTFDSDDEECQELEQLRLTLQSEGKIIPKNFRENHANNGLETFSLKKDEDIISTKLLEHKFHR